MRKTRKLTRTAALQKPSGAAFDETCIDHEATHYVTVLMAPGDTLIPHARSTELEALLVNNAPGIRITSGACARDSIQAVSEPVTHAHG